MMGRPSYHMTADELRRWGHAAVDWVADYLDTIERHPVVPDVVPGDIRALLPPSPPGGRGDPGLGLFGHVVRAGGGPGPGAGSLGLQPRAARRLRLDAGPFVARE